MKGVSGQNDYKYEYCDFIEYLLKKEIEIYKKKAFLKSLHNFANYFPFSRKLKKSETKESYVSKCFMCFMSAIIGNLELPLELIGEYKTNLFGFIKGRIDYVIQSKDSNKNIRIGFEIKKSGTWESHSNDGYAQAEMYLLSILEKMKIEKEEETPIFIFKTNLFKFEIIVFDPKTKKMYYLKNQRKSTTFEFIIESDSSLQPGLDFDAVLKIIASILNWYTDKFSNDKDYWKKQYKKEQKKKEKYKELCAKFQKLNEE